MSLLNEIKAPVEEHIREFEKKFKDSMRSKVPLLDRITAYLVKRKGKQIRPLFVFLSAQLCGNVNESTYRAASLIELLHTATLIHDDVVDDSNERRGVFSLNALWKNKISVLIGDFLLSKGLLLSLDNNDFELLRIVANATREMSEGELLQIDKARRLDISEEVYFEIIRKKTASLIASCCASGAASVAADKETIEKMHRFGELTGIAFQIRDDLFDYSNSLETGKPNGIDIKEKKMTLPLIHLLSNSNWMEKRRIINVVKNHNDNPAKVNALIQEVSVKGGIAYAETKMTEYKAAALALLQEFPDSEAKSSLEKLVNFTTERKF
ncbi:MAG: polyprenyl synthetase family protein [Lentimicrobium sp.]|jgi:octaprenyl-diphosphate synthase|nr:polyprenyl synthetase family protein [Lentimicrobium sp.]